MMFAFLTLLYITNSNNCTISIDTVKTWAYTLMHTHLVNKDKDVKING